MNSSKIIAIDLDGTIIDCYPRQAAVTEYIFNELEINNIDFQVIWEHKRSGLSTVEVLKSYFPEINPKIIKSFTLRWLELIEEPYWITFDQLFPWSQSILETLNSIGFNLVLLTARQRPENVFDFLTNHGIHNLFSQVHIVSPQKATEQKADLLLQVNPLCHCGDTETDALAAEKANVRFIGVSCGQRSKYFLERYTSVVILDNISELPKFIIDFSR
ncbi:HAD family hydrolase [Thermosynechococcus sp. CL-1]|uniref:HAD family hydrolase n=1 Tax=Thermosynechococcus sp. CL-1 TaxID=2583530 RepID=UPI00122DCA4C|nr:HAD hydrolase-like protein [Thermosynechococcus sp. CL-1]QEQ01514.1 HAD family hydrolase [Thermosynechococcus sp. CL-1]